VTRKRWQYIPKMMEPRLTKTLLVHSILEALFFLRFMIKCDKQGPRCLIWYHGRCVKISARRAKKNRQIYLLLLQRYSVQNIVKKNEGILAPKPLGRGIWRDFYALFPGDLVGFCLIVKTNPRGCPGDQPPGKPMISAQVPRSLLSFFGFLHTSVSKR